MWVHITLVLTIRMTPAFCKLESSLEFSGGGREGAVARGEDSSELLSNDLEHCYLVRHKLIMDRREPSTRYRTRARGFLAVGDAGT